MQQTSKYRVTGSLFFLALAVIFLPMLFDGAGVGLQEIPPVPPVSTEFAANASKLREYRDVAPGTDVVEKVTSLKANIDADGYHAQHGTKVGEPRLTPYNAQTQIWAVQVASFAERSNAEALRGKMQKGNFEAFISSHKVAGGATVHRVAVGPLLSLDDAKRLQELLGPRYKLQPDIVEMHP